MASLKEIGEPTILLNESDRTLEGLRSIPWIERSFLREIFKREKIYLGPSYQWLNRSWDLRIASVRGTIYKVALEAKATDQQDAVKLSSMVYEIFQNKLGSTSERTDSIFIWDADDGNAILQLANVMGDRRIMVFFTSRIVRSFKLK